MFLKLVKCLCITFSILGVRPQRVWGPANGGYNSGYSNSWNSNAGFSQSNKNPFFGSINNGYLNFGGRPKDISTSSSNWGYEASTNAPRWSSNNSGGSGNRQDNRRPNEKKSGAIINQQSSSQWNTNSDSVPSVEDNNLPFSKWGSNAVGQGQNGRPSQDSNWNSNNLNNYNNNVNNNNNNYNNNNGNNNNYNNNNGNSNNYNNIGSNNDNYNKPNGNGVQSEPDLEDNSLNSIWGSNNKKKLKPTSKPNTNWETTTTQRSNKNPGNTKFEKNKKPQKPSGSTSDNSSSNGKEKNPVNNNNQNEKKGTSLDTSILDELDKNDWYFGKESNYPKPPFKSTLNIDVSELWNFDKNRKSDKNSRGSNGSSSSSSGGGGGGRGSNSNYKNSRRNRQIEGFGETVEGVKCECVSVDLCDEDDMIITQEDIKDDFRSLEEFRCEKLTEVCCTNPKIKVKSIQYKEQQRLRCGQRRIGENPLDIYGENVAEPGEFPWSLKLENTEVNCSASLIHHKMALTAAHCVTGALSGELTAKAGVWNSNNEPFQTRQVAKIIPHPDYSSRNPRNDIALLVLETPFELTDNVNTICLPVTNDKWDPNQCIVAGWRPEEIQGQVLQVLEKGTVDFLPQTECQNIMLVTDLWRNYILHDSFVCGVERTRRQSCTGEEGGFVVCPSKKQADTFIQVGIVSEGMNCDNFGRPGIFTNVLKFLDWINENYFDLGLFDDIDVRGLQ